MNAQKLSALLVVVLLIVSAAAVFGWRKVSDLERANAALQSQLADAQNAVEHAQAAAKNGGAAARSELQAQKSELMRLRNEVTQLRGGSQALDSLRSENSQLKSLVEQLRTSSAQGALTPPPLNDSPETQFTREQWTFAGYASPEDALVSAIWAMKEGQPGTYLDSLSPEEQERMAQIWAGQTEQQVAAKHQQDVANISSLSILTTDTSAPNEVRMTVRLDGVDRTEQVRMQQIGGEWKFGGFIRESN